MDYEKKYKEALELARVAAFNGHQSLMEGVFPELKESEDEKIRKRIIALVNAHGQGIYKDDMLAWLENIPYTIDHEKREGFHLGYKAGLEKQGDSPIKWNKNTEGNKPQVNHSVLMKTTYGIAEGEWKGEYWEQYRWAGIVRDSDVLSWIELSDLDKQGEQKPAWSEVDKDFMYDTLSNLTELKDRYGEGYGNVGKCIKWLKSLKDRMQPQQKQEWSGGDEAHLHSLIIHLEQWIKRHPNTIGADIQGENIAWLKSLKERYTWKPSDKQMKFLQKCIEAYNEVTFPTEVRVLSSLYKDLKKLKGE